MLRSFFFPVIRVRGSVLENVTRFLGIPFAAPPIGELRWAAPAPAAPWTGVRDALFNAPDCIAGPGNYIDVANKSEDCLLARALVDHLVC
jgi:carboxylesterase type B